MHDTGYQLQFHCCTGVQILQKTLQLSNNPVPIIFFCIKRKRHIKHQVVGTHHRTAECLALICCFHGTYALTHCVITISYTGGSKRQGEKLQDSGPQTRSQAPSELIEPIAEGSSRAQGLRSSSTDAVQRTFRDNYVQNFTSAFATDLCNLREVRSPRVLIPYNLQLVAIVQV